MPVAATPRAQRMLRVSRAVAALPAPHRGAIVWCYISKEGPGVARKRLGTTYEGLAQLLRDGRQLLVNRGA